MLVAWESRLLTNQIPWLGFAGCPFSSSIAFVEKVGAGSVTAVTHKRVNKAASADPLTICAFLGYEAPVLEGKVGFGAKAFRRDLGGPMMYGLVSFSNYFSIVFFVRAGLVRLGVEYQTDLELAVNLSGPEFLIPPAFMSQVLALQVGTTTPSSFGTDNQTQGFVRVRQMLCQLSYILSSW